MDTVVEEEPVVEDPAAEEPVVEEEVVVEEEASPFVFPSNRNRYTRRT